jgi:hypothetical protein
MPDFSFLAGTTGGGRIVGASSTAATTAALLAAAPASAAVTARPIQETVFVDVGAKRIDSQVVRDGIPVGVHAVDPERLGTAIVGRPILRVRIVSQSIPPGTPVPQGTSVNVVMANPFELPVGVISGTHLALRESLIGPTFTQLVQNNPQVQRIVARASTGTLAPEDETAVREIFGQQGIEVTDEPGRDVGAAVESLRVLTTFGQ